MVDENNQSSFLKSFIRGTALAIVGTIIYLTYRFIRPYWYYMRFPYWLGSERDYIQDFNRSLHWLGFYEFEVHLREEGDPEITISNRNRRVPVIVRAEREFEPGLLATLDDRSSDNQYQQDNERQQLLEEVEWALNGAPGISWFTDWEGNPCAPGEAVEGVKIEYRIYPDAVSQHELLNSIVEIANAFQMIARREEKYRERLIDGR